MILNEDVAELLFKLDRWAKGNHVEDEAWKIIDETVRHLVRLQVKGLALSSDTVKAFVGELLTVADSYGYGQQAETALRELEHGDLIPPTFGLFDVSFAGVTVKLVLPISRSGHPHGVHAALADAISNASFVPATVEPASE